MAKIVIEIKKEKEVYDAFLKKYPMPSNFEKPEDWIKEKFKRDIQMIVQEYDEEIIMDVARKQVNEILKTAQDSIKVKDDIIE